MKLVPFSPEMAPLIYQWNQDKNCQRFFRGLKRFLTLQECSNLPAMLGLEVLGIMHEELGLVGIVDMAEESYNVVRFSLLIDPTMWKKGLGTEAMDLLQDYAFNMKAARLLLTEISIEDRTCLEGLKRFKFEETGYIPEYCFHQGKFEDAVLFCKRRQSWA